MKLFYGIDLSDLDDEFLLKQLIRLNNQALELQKTITSAAKYLASIKPQHKKIMDTLFYEDGGCDGDNTE